MFEDVENLRDVDATGTGRWETDDFVASIGGAEWLAGLGDVAGKVRLREQAAVGLHPVRRGLGEGAAIEPVAPLLCQRAKRFREVGLAQRVAGLPWRSVGLEENGAAGWELLDVLRHARETAGVVARHGEAGFGKFCGAEAMVFPRQLSELRHGLVERGDFAGHAGCERASLAEFGHGLTIAEEHVPRRLRRGSLATINRHDLAVRAADDEEASAADAGVVAVHDAESEASGDDGVHSVPTTAHRVHARVSRKRMHGGDHAALGGDSAEGKDLRREGAKNAKEDAERDSFVDFASPRGQHGIAVVLHRTEFYAKVSGPSKIVRLMTSVFATCGPWRSPFGAWKSVPGP